jgi:hypothetical protein
VELGRQQKQPLARPVLALDAVGGESGARLADALAEVGTAAWNRIGQQWLDV